METYSAELVRAMEVLDDVQLTLRALPGRSNGHPPGILALTNFLLVTAYQLLRKKQQYEIVHFGDMVMFPLCWWNSIVSHASVNVISVHGLDLLYGLRSGWKPALYRWFLEWAKRRRHCAACYIANSRNTAEIARRMGFEPAYAVPLGVRLNGPPNQSAGTGRHVLFIGRLLRRKGARWFAENVLPRLPEDVRFKVVGKAWDRDEAVALQKISRVDYLGYLSDAELIELKARTRVMVMPNIPSESMGDVEGFGLAALEAGAGGLPLVASDIEGLTDAVRHGETGFLVPAGDIDAWVGQIIELLEWDDSSYRTFASRARTALREHYTWQRVAEDTLAVYRGVRDAAPGLGNNPA